MDKNTKRSIKKLEENQIIKLFENPKYLDRLNYKQKIAATSIEGNYLVLAGPGSGKTYTLVYRVIHMLKKGILSSEIVVITFTRKAADELKKRIKQQIGNVELGFVGTIHAFAMHIKNRSKIMLKWRLLDPEDEIVILKIIKENENIKFSKHIKYTTIRKIISYAINTKQSLYNSLIDMGKENLLNELESIEKINECYTNYKRDKKYLNYDDILNFFILQLNDNNYFGKYNYLMVDEYQDINKLQMEFIKKKNVKNVMAIGDDFQGIYRFMGSDPNIILNFYNDFQDSKLIILEQNYRSTKNIVEILNKTIVDAKIGYYKKLFTTNKNGAKVKFCHISNNYINEILGSYQDHINKKHAFIYRANSTKVQIEKELILRKIDYIVYGGIRLLERHHIKDVFAILLTYYNHEDELSYMRTLMMLEGIGEKTAKKIISDKIGNYYKKNNELKMLNEILNSKEENISNLVRKIISYYKKLKKPQKTCNYTITELEVDYNIILNMVQDYNSALNFINDIILDGSIDMYSKNKQNINFILTTIHSSKGLEFDFVYHYHTNFHFDDYSLEKLEENRRLFYVAISRAKENLIIYIDNPYKQKITLNNILNDFKYSSFNLNNSYEAINSEEPYSDEGNQEGHSKDEKEKGIIKLIFDFIKKLF